MTNEIPVLVDAALLVALWIWALWGRFMRSVRTVLLLIAATALYLVAAQLPLAIGIPVRTVVIAGCLWAMLLHPTWFVAMRLGDRIFDTAYSAVLEDLRALADRRMSGDIGIPQFVTELEDLALRLEQLPGELRDTMRRWLADVGRLHVDAFSVCPRCGRVRRDGESQPEPCLDCVRPVRR